MPRYEDLKGTTEVVFSVGNWQSGITKFARQAFGFSVKTEDETALADVEVAGLRVGRNNKTIRLKAPDNLASDTLFVLPGSDGSPLQAIVTDGKGNLSFATTASTADKQSVDSTIVTFGSTSTVPMFTLPAGAVIDKIKVVIKTPFNADATMTIGSAENTSKYMAAYKINLKAPAKEVFVSSPGEDKTTAPEPLIATFSAAGSSTGEAAIYIYYSMPT